MQQGTKDENRRFNLLDLYQTYLKNNKGNRRDIGDEFENWSGRWMPDRLGDPTPPPKVYPYSKQSNDESMVEHHQNMGQISSDCDDAKVDIVTFYVNSSLEQC